MADGFTIGATAIGLDEAQRRMQERAARMKDLSPALRVVAADLEERTDRAFRDLKSPAGEIWPTLAPSTQLARAAKLPGAKRRSKKTGKLTKGALHKRAAGIAGYQFGGAETFKALVDTGRMRGSVRVRVKRHSLEFAAIGYMGPHITGSTKRPGRPPKRNPTVFERAASGQLEAIAPVMSLLMRSITFYVSAGERAANRALGAGKA